jgi:uncharacterized protein (TIGR02996 family)
MTTERAFLADIIEHPDDDAPRLVFADWLDDRGDEARAEFIRLQCRLASNPDIPDRESLLSRESELLNEHGCEWAEPLRDCVDEFQFRRGFVEAVAITDFDGCSVEESLREAMKAAPIRSVHLECEDVSRLRTLQKRVPDLARLREFYLRPCNPPPAGDLGALLRSKSLARLTALWLYLETVNEEHLPDLCALVQPRVLPRLIELGVLPDEIEFDLDNPFLTALAGAKHLGRLRRLHLPKFYIHEPSLAKALADSSAFAGLEGLNLREVNARPDCWQVLFASPGLEDLCWLYLADATVQYGQSAPPLSLDSVALEVLNRFGPKGTSFDCPEQMMPHWSGMSWK